MSSRCRSACNNRTLMIQQPLLCRHSSGKSGESSVGANHTMTWHHDRQRVASIGSSHCASRRGATHRCGLLCIGERCTVWDRCQHLPGRLLELCPDCGKGQIEPGPHPGEILLELATGVVEEPRVRCNDRRTALAPVACCLESTKVHRHQGLISRLKCQHTDG